MPPTTRPAFSLVSLLAYCAFALTAASAPISAAETAADAKQTGDAKPLAIWQVTDGITFVPGFRLQTRYTHDQTARDNFQIQRFRLKGSGKLYGFAAYGAELKIDNTGTASTGSAAVENAWVEFTKLPQANLRVGLYDIPFSRSNLTSDSKLLFADRSEIRGRLSKVGISDNTIGALFHGRPMDGLLEYSGGVFQNEDYREVPTWSGRFALNLLDKPKQGGYGDYRGSYIGEGKRLAIAVSGAYMSDAKTASMNFDLYAAGADLFFNYGPLTFQGEYGRFQQSFTGATPNATTQGGYVQAGYVLPLQSLAPDCCFPTTEVALRYQDFEGNYVDAKDVRSFDDRHQWTSIGTNFYFRGHNLKVQADYTFKREEKVPVANDLFQIQLQLDF